MTRVRRFGLGGLAIVAWAALAAPRVSAAPPATPAEVEAFAAKDLEARWVAYHAAPEPVAAWVAFLAQRKDYELLELLALTTRTLEALDALQVADAPGWLRCATWRLTSSDSHAMDAARKFLLDRRPGAFLAWVARYPSVLEGPSGQPAASVARLIEGQEPRPSLEDVARYAPPFDADVVLAALTPPAEVADLGAAPRAAPGVVYVHQVVRALEAWAMTNRRVEPWNGRVAALVGATSPAIAKAAALACAWLPRADVPVARLLALLDARDRPADVRAAALVGLSFSPAAEAYLRVCAVAADPAHVAWSAAVSRLGDVGDELALAVLAGLTLADEADVARDAARAAIAGRLAAEEAPAAAARTPGLLGRVARAEAVGDARAPVYAAAAVRALAGKAGWAEVRAALEALRDTPPSADDEGGRVAALARKALEEARAGR
ncbi:MAG: hypothetical protein JNM10_04840 [Planctomycetia bacterium]|nr:hypothetical protein [Planctomycetia bacterium]